MESRKKCNRRNEKPKSVVDDDSYVEVYRKSYRVPFTHWRWTDKFLCWKDKRPVSQDRQDFIFRRVFLHMRSNEFSPCPLLFLNNLNNGERNRSPPHNDLLRQQLPKQALNNITQKVTNATLWLILTSHGTSTSSMSAP